MSLQTRIDTLNKIYSATQPEHMQVINELVKRLKMAKNYIETGGDFARYMDVINACDLTQ